MRWGLYFSSPCSERLGSGPQCNVFGSGRFCAGVFLYQAAQKVGFLRIALHNSIHNRFVRLCFGCNGFMQKKVWAGREVFLAVPLFCLHMTSPQSRNGARMDVSGVKAANALPDGWTWERRGAWKCSACELKLSLQCKQQQWHVDRKGLLPRGKLLTGSLQWMPATARLLSTTRHGTDSSE